MSATAQRSIGNSASASTIKILYAEGNEQTLSGNASEMKKAGHDVTTALSRQSVLEALRHEAFDLVILGATLSKDDRHHLPYMVRKSQTGAKILVMHSGTHHHEVDAVVDPSLSVQRILEKIASMINPVTAR